jgi:hypothetical protein
MAEPVRWWSVRRAQNLKPSTYRCPFCHGLLPALSEHVLIAPEGDASKRRHAHTACVLAARRRGALPTREEWRKAQKGERDRPPLAARLTGVARRLRRR